MSPSDATTGLVGRAEDLAKVYGFVDRAAADGGAPVVRGRPPSPS
jgi:hypothetical protein